VEAISIEVARLRGQCSDPGGSADPELSGLRRRYLRLLESEPVPSDPLRRDIRRDLARSEDDGMRVTVIALLVAAAAVFAFAHWMAAVAPNVADTIVFGLNAGLLLTVPAIVANEASKWRSSLRTSSRSELNALLPAL
jgi:hypothetical protein